VGAVQEPRKSDAPQLRDEYRSYRTLNGTRTPLFTHAAPALTAKRDALPLLYASYWYPVGVPQVHHFGQEGLHNVLAIDLLGPNLEDLFDMCGRKFSIKTVCMAAKQMVSSSPVMVDPCMPGVLVLCPESSACASGYPNSIGP
jgi:casein kinase 1